MNVTKTNFRTNLWNLTRPYWFSDEKWLAFSLLGLIILGEIAQVLMMVFLNDWQKGFYDAIQAFNSKLLIHYLGQFAGLVAVFVVVNGYSAYFGGLLVARWRRWSTHYYLNKWVIDKNYYSLNLHSQQVDNPDQRIADDLSEFPALTLTLVTGILGSLITLVSFSVILWHLSGVFRFPVINMIIPGYMFWGALIFAMLGTWVTFVIGAKLAGLSYQQERFNADFRFRLVRIREAAEQIAFYQGEQDENKRLVNSFSFIFDNSLKIIKLQKYLNFFTTAYLNFSRLAGTLLALPRYLAQRLQIGILMQCSSAFISVNEAFSYLIYAYKNIASWQAVVNRLTEFNEHMLAAQAANAQQKIIKSNQADSMVTINNLNIDLPNGKRLLTAVNLTIKQAEKLLIQGDSGSGKSTLLRAIAGLWPFGDGEIGLPENQRMLFFPQKPYLPLGTLRAALAYPNPASIFNDVEISEVLTQCNLVHLLDSIDIRENWSHVLSLGEQQRVAFARLFLQKPAWVFLDEATSALDEGNEAKMYQILLEKLPTTTLISVGHRSSLVALHNRIIQMKDYK